MATKERESNFELLRVFAMFCIVLYHLILEPSKAFGYAEIRTLWLPLHIGVPLFILISGYFHIRPSFKGLVKLLLPLFAFYVPIELCGGGNVASILFVLDKTPYWFVRTYIILFLMAPILNMYLDRIMFKERFILLCILFFIAVYLGIRSDDTSLVGGKNIVNFMFIYSIGDTLMVFKERVNNVRTYKYVMSWILLNVLVMLGYQFTGCNPLWVASFSYCGPILILNATLLFCIFSKISIKSSTINAMGTSMFSVYILHCDPTVLK